MSLSAALAALDPGMEPEAIAAAYALLAPLVPDPACDGRDLAYGDHPRQRLDLYRPEIWDGETAFLFVPGGGFVGGDKALPGGPFHGNVARAAAARGAFAAVMNYRLAPEHGAPAGAEDVAAAAAWLMAETGARRLVLAGHSAGASHVADCVAAPGLRPAALAGAALVSGVYHAAVAPVSPGRAAYYGAAACDSVPALAALGLPVFAGVAERDPAVFRSEGARLAGAAGVPLHVAAGHTHISIVAAVGSPVDALAPAMLAALGL